VICLNVHDHESLKTGYFPLTYEIVATLDACTKCASFELMFECILGTLCTLFYVLYTVYFVALFELSILVVVCLVYLAMLMGLLLLGLQNAKGLYKNKGGLNK